MLDLASANQATARLAPRNAPQRPHGASAAARGSLLSAEGANVRIKARPAAMQEVRQQAPLLQEATRGSGRSSFADRIGGLFDERRKRQTEAVPANAFAPEEGMTERSAAPDVAAPSNRHPHTERIVHAMADNGDRPLVDLFAIVDSIFRHRALIAVLTLIGAILGVLLALSTPKMYYAETRLFIDPREIRLTQDDLQNPLLSTEAMIAMTDSQQAILTSTNVLVKVVDDLGLARDPEFNGDLNSGGLSGGIALIKQLFSGADPKLEAETKAIEYLREHLDVSRDPKTFVINIGVRTRSPEKSATVANSVVETYLKSEDDAQSGLMEQTSEAIDKRLETLRSDLNAAERAVENFKADNDLVAVGDQLIDDTQVGALNQQLANARANKVSIRVKAENLQRANVTDVIEGAFPEEFLSANLVELRKQYSQSKTNADSLSANLGPRHPQYMSAASSLNSIKQQIQTELRRIVASAQAELQRAVETEQELASQLAVAKTKSLDNSEELVTMRELQRKAAATREIYEAFLKRSREASERGNLQTQNARVISPAEPPLKPFGSSRKIIAIASTVGGFILGVGIAVLLGLIESLRGFFSGPGGTGSRNAPRPASPSPEPAYRSEPPHFARKTAQPSPAVAEVQDHMPDEELESEVPTLPQQAEAQNFNQQSEDSMYPMYPNTAPWPAQGAHPQQPVHPYPPHSAHPYPPQPAYGGWPQQPMMMPPAQVWPQPQPYYPAPQPQPFAPQYAAPFYPAPPQPAQFYHHAPYPAQMPAEPQRPQAPAKADDSGEIAEIRAKMNELRARLDKGSRRRSVGY